MSLVLILYAYACAHVLLIHSNRFMSSRITDYFPRRKRRFPSSDFVRAVRPRLVKDMAYARTRRSSRYTKGRKRLFSRRRGYRRRGVGYRSRRRRPFSSINYSRKKLLDILTVPNYATFQQGFQAVVDPTLASSGKPVRYAAPNGSIPHRDHIRVIANHMYSAPTSALLKFFLTKMVLRYEYSNMSLGTTYMTAYFCRVRRDLFNTQNQIDPLVILEKGFDETAHAVSGGDVLLESSDVSPFQSKRFVQYFHIYKTKKLKLQGGESGKLAVKIGRSMVIQANEWLQKTGDSETFLTMQQILAHKRGGKFILFRIEGEVTNNEADKTQVTATSPRVNFISHYHYTYKSIVDSVTNLHVADSVGISTALAPEIITEQGQQDIA